MDGCGKLLETQPEVPLWGGDGQTGWTPPLRPTLKKAAHWLVRVLESACGPPQVAQQVRSEAALAPITQRPLPTLAAPQSRS
jgi:hypothetical protein